MVGFHHLVMCKRAHGRGSQPSRYPPACHLALLFATLLAHAVGCGAIFGVVGVVVVVVAFVFQRVRFSGRVCRVVWVGYVRATVRRGLQEGSDGWGIIMVG